MMLIGVGLLVGAGFAGLERHRFVEAAERAQAVVPRLNAGGSHPQIEFTTASGQKVSYALGGLIFGYRPGDRVEVLYLPAEPRKACIDAFGAKWFWPLMLAGLGVFFTGLAWFG